MPMDADIAKIDSAAEDRRLQAEARLLLHLILGVGAVLLGFVGWLFTL